MLLNVRGCQVSKHNAELALEYFLDALAMIEGQIETRDDGQTHIKLDVKGTTITKLREAKARLRLVEPPPFRYEPPTSNPG